MPENVPTQKKWEREWEREWERRKPSNHAAFNRYVPTVPTNSHLYIVSWKILHTMHEFHASHAKFHKNMVCI